MVKAKPASAGVSGMLLRAGEQYGIAHATHIKSEGFQRFSIAHEIGHYRLPGHLDHVLGDRDIHESRAGFVSPDRYELEADHFAAGLLMPSPLFSDAMKRTGEGLEAIETLSDLCNTSRTATAIRYTQCTDLPTAIVMSTGRQVDYCFMSAPLEEMRGLDWLKRGEPVPPGTATWHFNQDSENVLCAERREDTGDLRDWFGGSKSIEICEEVLGLGGYGKTLTVVTGLQDPEEEDDEWDEPRFHKSRRR